MRKSGGQLSTNGVKLFSVTSHKFILGRTSVYMYGRNVEKGWRPDFVKGRTDHKFSVKVWGCICYNCVGTLTKVESNVNANKYISILEDHI